MNISASRLIYRAILRLHPSAFRDEFAPDMLWIFDQEHGQGATAHLLLDGTISLLRQRCRLRNNPGQLSIASGVLITGPGISPLRLLQATIVLSLICFSCLFLEKSLNASVLWSDRMPCYTVTLRAPSHAEVVLQPTP
jgi:hypothetical protein